MDKRVVITRRVGVTDAEGRPSGVGTVAADVVGDVVDLSASELPAGGTLGQQTTAAGVVPLTADVIGQDTLTVTYPASGRSIAYRVVAVHEGDDVLLVDLARDVT